MAESSKKRKGSSASASASRAHRSGATSASTAPIPPSLSSSPVFSSDEQQKRYSNLFSSRSIIDPKFIDMEFFSAETFDCIQAFQNLGLLPFMSLQLPIYPELVKAFYCNLEIQDSTLISEIFGIKMVIDQSLFHDLTKLPSDGVPFEGTLNDDWKFDFSAHDARQLVCTNNADMTGRLLAGSLAFESRILHYLIVRILLPRSSNLAQVSEEDLIIMWAFHTGRQLDWAHLVRYRMHKALRLNAPLPYPQLVTLFFRHFQIPLDSEPYVPIKRSFLIGAAVIASFGYRKEHDGSWVKKGAQPADDEGNLPVEDNSTLLRRLMDKFDGLQTFVGDKFDAMELQVDMRFDAMESRITRVEEDVSFIRTCFDPPPPPPSSS